MKSQARHILATQAPNGHSDFVAEFGTSWDCFSSLGMCSTSPLRRVNQPFQPCQVKWSFQSSDWTWYDRSTFHLKFNFPKKEDEFFWPFGYSASYIDVCTDFWPWSLQTRICTWHLPSPAENLKIFNEWPWPWITYCICCICKDMYTYYIRFNYISTIISISV